MRILYLSPLSALGGAERVLLTCLAAVRQAEPRAELALLCLSDGPLRERAAALGVETHLLPLPERLAVLGDSQAHGGGSRWKLGLQTIAALPPAWSFARRLRAECQRLAPDVLHSNGIKTHLLLHAGGVKFAPVLWHVHDFYGSRPLSKRLLRWAGQGAAAAVAVSEAVARDVGPLLPGVPVRVIHNAIDTDEFKPGPCEPAQLDALAGLPPAGPTVIRVGLVATYARWKGHDVFLESVRQFSQRDHSTPARFYIVGGPIYQTGGSQCSENELRYRAVELGIADRVGFVGFQSSPASVYRALDVVVHASTQPEPFGLTIVEAMACGRAVVASQEGGAVELFEHGRTALGVPPGEPTALAEALHGLVQDAGLRRQLGSAARAAAVARFARERLGPQLLDCYAGLLGVRPLLLAARARGQVPAATRTG